MSIASESPQPAYRFMARAAWVLVAVLLLVLVQISRLERADRVSLQTLDPSTMPAYRQELADFQWSSPVAGQLRRSDLLGKTTLLSFWSFRCPPCLQELPLLAKASAKFKALGYDLLLVNLDSDKANELPLAMEFWRQLQPELQTLFDPEQTLQKQFQLEGLPSHVVVNDRAQVIWKMTGSLRWQEARVQKFFSDLKR